MLLPQHISIADYTYELPTERIAQYPLPERDHARLLVFENGRISSSDFKHLSAHLPENTLLVFNDTKVIHARLHFTLPNGKLLEIFCLEPFSPADYQQNFSAIGEVRWKCLIGGNRKWKSGIIEENISTPQGSLCLRAERISRLEDAFELAFSWDLPFSFGEVLHLAGVIPLPPYLQRPSEASDSERYQTLYARLDGSVAAPTAGLHFTKKVFENLSGKNIGQLYVTLHVGAGTFKPVTSDTIGKHHMHKESIYMTQEQLNVLLNAMRKKQKVVCVGTTSARLLESLYWHGCRLLNKKTGPGASLNLPQWAPYKEPQKNWEPVKALEAVRDQMEHLPGNMLQGQTSIIIAPGYPFKILDGLITNFHQPKSTLLLLVAALIGENWKQVYQYALNNNFRFLSYGDGSLLWKTTTS